MRWITILALILVLAPACQREPASEDADQPADTTAAMLEPGGATGGPGTENTETTTGGGATTATTPEATGAPSPPGGYAVESRPAGNGALATIEYVSPRTVAEVAEFYDSEIATDRRVELDVAGDDIVVYGMGSSSTVGPATRIQDVERLLDQRNEPMVVVAPHRMQSNDPLIQDLRGVGQQAQADALLGTRSKVTVVYAVQ
jgi:hypothetical protein